MVFPSACPTTCRTLYNATSARGCSCSAGSHGHTSGSPVVSLNQQQTPAHHHTAVALHIPVLPVLPLADPQLCFLLWLWSTHPWQMSTHTEVVYVVGESSKHPNMAPPLFPSVTVVAFLG